jgi:hypothetical protein
MITKQPQQGQGQRKGTVVVPVAVCMTGLLAIIALALDGGLFLDKRRQTQAAADAAALAAASELYATCFTNGGLDEGPLPSKNGPAAGQIALFAKRVAKDHGFEDGVDGVVVTVNIPPKSGPFTGQRGHVEVYVSMQQTRGFSVVFGSRSKVPIGSRAVARGTRNTINNGIIVLHPTEKGSFQNSGGGSVTVKGTASVIVNSFDPAAMIANGGGSVSSEAGYDVGGSPGYITPGGGSFTGTINPNQEPTPDPLRFVPEPDPSTMVVRSTKRITHSSASTLVLQPGLYIGGISISGKANVILMPGIYYMQGGFSFTGQGSLTGNEVMIYNDPQSISQPIDLTGQGSITLTPPLAGPYQGISLFQRRSGDPQPTLKVTGNGTAPLRITGTFYAAGALLDVTGNGTQDTIGSQYISLLLKLGGNGTFNVDWDPAVVPGVRQVWLVE